MLTRFTATLRKGEGTHMLPVRAAIRKAIGKSAGDVVEVCLEERLDGAAEHDRRLR